MNISLKELVLIFMMANFGVAASILSIVMIGRVNEKLPEGQRVSYLRWGPIRKLHRQLYPESKLVLVYDLCTVGIGVCFIVAIVFF